VYVQYACVNGVSGASLLVWKCEFWCWCFLD
jgi:hypothetical protein